MFTLSCQGIFNNTKRITRDPTIWENEAMVTNKTNLAPILIYRLVDPCAIGPSM